MPNALLTAVSGLVAHQRRLDVVANNLANLNTTAFKSQRVLFSDLFYETITPATFGTEFSVGGTNPNQIGMGVKTSQIAKTFTQGELNSTGKSFDYALQGEGFFVLTDGSRDYYTRAGAFSLDENGNLVDPATGFKVRRIGSLGEGDAENPAFQMPGVNTIQVPLSSTIRGSATNAVQFTGNLSSLVTGPLNETLTTAAPLQSGGAAATAATLLNDLDSNQSPYGPGDAVTISGMNADGTTFNTSINVDGTTTVGDLISAVNAAASDATLSLDASGNLVFAADQAGPAFLSLSFEDDDGNAGQTSFSSHAMILTTMGKHGDAVEGTMEVFDVRGSGHLVSYRFIKQAANEWDLELSMDPAQGTISPTTIQGIRFNDDGSFHSVQNGAGNSLEVTFQFDEIAAPQTVAVHTSSLTQIALESNVMGEQDGYSPSKLVAVNVNSDGALQGITSNGLRFPLAQLAIAMFRNPSGLEAGGDSYYVPSLNSGMPEFGVATSNGRGTIRTGHLEGSNVDIALEFTQLIVAQRGFSANARTITVADNILAELTNIIR